MKKFIRETAEEILQEYTSCYSEADEDCLVKMLEKLASNMAREIFEEIDKICRDYNRYEFGERGLFAKLADLKKKYESEG
jgi:hypothetical protein